MTEREADAELRRLAADTIARMTSASAAHEGGYSYAMLGSKCADMKSGPEVDLDLGPSKDVIGFPDGREETYGHLGSARILALYNFYNSVYKGNMGVAQTTALKPDSADYSNYCGSTPMWVFLNLAVGSYDPWGEIIPWCDGQRFPASECTYWKLGSESEAPYQRDL